MADRECQGTNVGTPLPGCPVRTDSSRRGCPCGSPPRHACRGPGTTARVAPTRLFPHSDPNAGNADSVELAGRFVNRPYGFYRRDTPPGVSADAPQTEGPGPYYRCHCEEAVGRRGNLLIRRTILYNDAGDSHGALPLGMTAWEDRTNSPGRVCHFHASCPTARRPFPTFIPPVPIPPPNA